MQKMMAQGGMQGGMNMQAMAKMMPQMQANMVKIHLKTVLSKNDFLRYYLLWH